MGKYPSCGMDNRASAVAQEQRRKKPLYDTWQTLEGRVKWCETSPYDYVWVDTEYFRDQADKARKAYNNFRGTCD